MEKTDGAIQNGQPRDTGNNLNDEQHGPHKNMGVNPGDRGGSGLFFCLDAYFV